MGGFTGLAVDVAEKGLEKAGQAGLPYVSAAASAGAKDLVDFASKHFTTELAMKTDSASGKIVKQLMDKYSSATDKHLSQIAQNPSQYFVRPVSQLHPSEIMNAARAKGSDEAFLQNKELLVGALGAFKAEHGEVAAHTLVDHLNTDLHESRFALKNKQGAFTGGESSNLALQLRTSPLTKGSEWPISRYEHPTRADVPRVLKPIEPILEKAGLARGGQLYTESLMHGSAAGRLTYKAGLLHTVSGPLNLQIDSSLKSAGITMTRLFGGNERAAFIARARANGWMGQYFLENLTQAMRFEHGFTKNLPGTPFWKATAGNWMIPGISWARKMNLVAFGMQGELEAHYLTADLLGSDLTKQARAREAMAKYGLDWRKIESQGALTNDDIGLAIHNNIKRKLMTETQPLRYRWFKESKIGRMVGAFHMYATGQRNFLMQAFANSWRAKDPMMAVKDMAILSIVFPDVGAGVRFVSDLWQGKDYEESKDKMTQTWKNTIPFMADGYTTGEAWVDRFDATAHLAGIGMLTSYFRAMYRHQLSEELLGSIPGKAIDLLQDTASAIHKDSDESLWDRLTPVKRDILSLPPTFGIGAYVARKMYPPGERAGGRTRVRRTATRRR